MNTTVPKIGSPYQYGLDCFFIEQNGNLFKSTLIYRYFNVINFYLAPIFISQQKRTVKSLWQDIWNENIASNSLKL